MSNDDLRIKRTHKLLKDALLELMIEEPFEKISVVDICERAMVHRATFYAHFQDKYDLLQYCMSDFEKPFEKEDVTSHDFQGYKKYYLRVASDIMEMLEKKSKLYQTLFTKNKQDSIPTNIRDDITEKINEKLKKCEENGINPVVPVEILSHFYGGGAMNIIEWWLENGMPVSAEKIVKYLDLLIQIQDFA